MIFTEICPIWLFFRRLSTALIYSNSYIHQYAENIWQRIYRLFGSESQKIAVYVYQKVFYVYQKHCYVYQNTLYVYQKQPYVYHPFGSTPGFKPLFLFFGTHKNKKL